MDKVDGIECATKGKGALAAPFILSAIGVPHLAVGLISAFLFRSELVGIIVGLAFCCSGLICLGIAAAFFLRWRNKRTVASSDGFQCTDSLGRSGFFPWSDVEVEEDRETGAVTLSCPLGKTKVYKSEEAYAELRGLLLSLGLVKTASPEPAETVRVVSEQKLF